MNVLVAAPHPDDETLGCGGTLLKLKQQGASVHWLVFTKMAEEVGYSKSNIEKRNEEMLRVASAFAFAGVHKLGFVTTKLDTVPMRELVSAVASVVGRVKPEVLFIPFPGDVHSDHSVAFRAMSACTKSFTFPTVRKVFAYEVLSETDFGLDPSAIFRPTSFSDISSEIERKLEIMKLYADEIRKFPFPRSEEAIKALARLRGVVAGCLAAEAFVVLKDLW